MYNVSDTWEMIKTFFSNPAWLVLFLLSVIYLFCTMSRTNKKVLIVVVVCFFLVINNVVFNLFISLGEGTTFYRNLWVIPYMTIIGIAVIDIVKRLPKTVYRVIFIVLFCVSTALIETVNPFAYYWRIPMDSRMVSSEVLKMNGKLEELQKESEKKLFVIGTDDMMIPLWLYNGKIDTLESVWSPYEKESWQQIFSAENLDVDKAMETGKQYGRDYVIVVKNENIQERFREKGYEPIFASDYYLMYAFS